MLQALLFVITMITTTLAGTELTLNKYLVVGMTWSDFLVGFSFSIPFLTILTVHEFGHYLTARYHKIKVSLPYYIPFWTGFILGPSIGTMGAFIRIREHIGSKLKYFDVGISGPIAGFVIAVGILFYGCMHLPSEEYIYRIHPEYQDYATIDEAIAATEGVTIRLGGNLLFNFFKEFVADPDIFPHESELMHYPWLLAGYLALFVTALNLLPIGQLDGGHVLFGLFGTKRHAIVSRILFAAFTFYACLGWVTVHDLSDFSNESMLLFLFSIVAFVVVVYLTAFSMFSERKDRLLYAVVMLASQFILNMITGWEGYQGWLVFSILLGRFMGVDHPPAIDNRELGIGRKILGWIALFIFIICFSPKPLIIEYYPIEAMP